MNKLVNLNSYPVNVVLKDLLRDMTTNKNIIFANSICNEINYFINDEEITLDILRGYSDKLIQPRVNKSIEQQKDRKRKKLKYLHLLGYVII